MVSKIIFMDFTLNIRCFTDKKQLPKVNVFPAEWYLLKPVMAWLGIYTEYLPEQ